MGALVFHNLEENVPVITTRFESDLIAARSCVEEAAKGIAEGIFDAKPGQHCFFCAYRTLCPEKEKRIPRLATGKPRASTSLSTSWSAQILETLDLETVGPMSQKT